ncbi:hypothetical protein ACYZUA_13415 [Pseudomonas sp. LS2P72]
MEEVVEPSNMRRAYKRVLKNRGAAGVDRLTVEELKDWLLVHWSSVKTALLEDQYLPRAVRRVDIPKPNGGVRTLGVPTVVIDSSSKRSIKYCNRFSSRHSPRAALAFAHREARWMRWPRQKSTHPKVFAG